MMSSANDAAKSQRKRRPKLIKRRPQHQTIRFTPYAWAKLLHLRDVGPSEIGGFGISALGSLLLVQGIRLVRQPCDWASVEKDRFPAEEGGSGRRGDRRPLRRRLLLRLRVRAIPGSELQRRGRNSKPKKRYVIDEAEAAWVKLIFHWYAHEKRIYAVDRL